METTEEHLRKEEVKLEAHQNLQKYQLKAFNLSLISY